MKRSLVKFVLFLVLTVTYSYGQLPDFTLNVTKTDETCTGNGTLSFTTQGTASGATVVYSIYLLPDTTTPIIVLTANSFTGLSSGLYRVVALQSLGAESNSQQLDIEIVDSRIPLVYQVSSSTLSCYVTTGSITVDVTQGIPVTYEIISGPIIVPPQASNVFTNLVAGTYDIRVNDNCGDGIVQTHTIQQVITSNLLLSIVPPDEVTACSLSNCESRPVNALITCQTGTIIHYPLQVQITVFPPGGGNPIVITQNITSGNELEQPFSFEIPFFNVPSYNYEIKVIGSCNEETILQGSQTTNPPSFSFASEQSSFFSCSSSLYLNQFCYMLPPYTVNFISAPAGFNPANFNSGNLGPFTGPIIVYDSPNQALPVGQYTVEVTDSCGNVVQQSIQISPPSESFILIPIECSSDQQLNFYDLHSLFLIEAPEELGLTLPLNLTDLINALNNYIAILSPGTYVFSGTTINCGVSFQVQIIIPENDFLVEVETNNLAGCGGYYGEIKLDGNNLLESVVLIQAPSAFLFSLPYDYTSLIFSTEVHIQYLPAGEYIFEVTDICGRIKLVTAIVPEIISNGPLILYNGPGCGSDLHSLSYASPNGNLTQFVITAAPPSFPFPLPYDVSFNIASNGFFCMNSLPVGGYTFHSVDACNVVRDETINLSGFIATESSTVIPNCGSFNLNLQYPNNSTLPQKFWLQKWNPNANLWSHPITGALFPDGSFPNTGNSYELTNLAINYNIASVGLFRVLIEYKTYQNGFYGFTSCVETIKTFTFSGALEIESTFSISCNSGNIEISIEASGVPPYNYKITTKNGLPFLVDNGSSNLFTGLEPAIYNFQIIDACGNILNKLIDLTTIEDPEIVPTNLCNGEVGQLSVPAISYLNYQWWKGTDTSTILSTTNVLQFNPFSATLSPGTYYVRLYSTSSISCLDKVISIVVNPVEVPNAGVDGHLSICGSTAPIDLFTVLEGTFQSGGIWQETTTSGGLTGNIWTANGTNYGTYNFTYTVTGLCDATDSAIVTIDYYEPPPIPQINGGADFCLGESIALQIDPIPNALVEWSGPNGFVFSGDSVLIENTTVANAGDYQVTITRNGCVTTNSVTVVFKPSPDYIIEEACVGTNYILKVVPIQNSFDLNEATILWTGPNGFSSTLSQIIANNLDDGTYAVTVTNQQDCAANQAKLVVVKPCEFPNLITPNDDGFNDSFDLTGFEIDNFKIYSRWGRLVYEENNYIDSWYGQNQEGKPLPDSTYYYIVSLHSGEQKHGWIFVAR